jgi:NADPH:quinone reductase-like Zn-dependent oxidoreductase
LLAALTGAVVATSAAHAQLLRDLGASRVIDYQTENSKTFSAGSMVFDTLGGKVQQRSFSVLKPGGILVAILDTSQSQQLAESHDVRVESFFMRPDGNGLEMLSKLVDSGKVRPVVDRTFPLADTASALLYSRSGRAKGKIVIAVG